MELQGKNTKKVYVALSLGLQEKKEKDKQYDH